MEGNLNPDIKQVTIGVKNLRTVGIYPLSLGQEKKMIEVIAQIITSAINLGVGDEKPDALPATNGIASMADDVDPAVLEDSSTDEDLTIFFNIITIIKNNIEEIISFVFDPEDDVKLDEITNKQLAIIAERIYEVNFEVTLKNFKDLFVKVKKSFLTERS